jgi:hypothetical protein
LVFQSKSNKLSSIYSIEYDRKKAYMLSGRNVFLNVKGAVSGIWEAGEKGKYLIQTEEYVFVWSVELESRTATFESEALSFRAALSRT